MLGAIIGDIVGSRFEFGPAPEKGFKLITPECSYTDDTICTIAIADAIMNHKSYKEALLEWCRRYPEPMGSYGHRLYRWINSDDPQPMNSYGNGAAMRVSPVGWLFNDYDEVKQQAQLSAEVSHNHPEGIKGAQCVATLIYWLRTVRVTKDKVERSVLRGFGYQIPPMADILRISANGYFDGTCQETVPMAIRCFLDADNFEDVIRKAVLCDGDTDTKAAIAGSIAEAYYPIPEDILVETMGYLPEDMLAVLSQYYDHMKDAYEL